MWRVLPATLLLIYCSSGTNGGKSKKVVDPQLAALHAAAAAGELEQVKQLLAPTPGFRWASAALH